MLKRILLLLTINVLIGQLLYAQVTTSNLSGVVTSPTNEPLTGATVRATHTPTGTVYQGTSTRNGRYNLFNMQPGGPYRVEVSFVGFGTVVKDSVFLNLGETGLANFSMDAASRELTGVTIVGTRRTPNIAQGGVETNISAQTIAAAPTVGRSLTDFLRLTPQAKTTFGGGISIAGQNNRYNQLMIDGAVNNDVFGLSETGANGGQTGAPPISIDAIESFQVGISPYDVSLGNFTGGSINAITKSGTNNFVGSAYWVHRNQTFAGMTPIGLKDNAIRLPNFQGNIFGFTVGGPIIRNKLFFFLSGELQRDERPQPFEPSQFRVANFQDSINLILQKLRSYNYDAGDFMNIPDLLNSERVAAKLTWNINNQHRMNISYRFANSERFNTAASTPTRINFFNNGFVFPSTTNSASFELNSNFTNRISNKLLVTYTNVHDDRDPIGDPFPRVTLNSTNGTSYVFGTENFSTANELKQNNFAVFNEFRYVAGAHQLKAGIDVEYSRSYNLFVRDAFGTYTYTFVSDFLQDRRPNNYTRSFSLVDERVGDGSEAGTAFNTMRMGAFIGDDWNISNNFRLSFGVRVDNFEFMTTPNEDTFFNRRAVPIISQHYDMRGARSGLRPNPNMEFSPRIGFTYNVPQENIKFRGGIGMFTGRVPLVWPGGVYNNTGVNVGGVNVNNPNITFRHDVNNQWAPQDLGATVGRPSGQIDLIAPDFRLPKVWKTSLGFDKRFGRGFTWTVDLLYQKNINEILYTNMMGVPGGRNSFGQDVYLTWSGTGNPVYNRFDFNPNVAGVQNPYATGIFLIHNAEGEKGYSYNFTTQLDKSFGRGWSANVAYSYGDSYSRFDGTSSQNNSQWRFMEAPNGRNNLPLSRSDFAQLHRFTALVAKTFNYANDRLGTTISMFYNGQSGTPYSYVYSRAMVYDQNGSVNETTDLVYVPRDLADWSRFAIPYTANGVSYSVAQQWELLNSFIENDSYLSKRRGQFTERNAAVLPFMHLVDLKVQQDFRLRMGGTDHQISVIFDMFNFTNFLNRNWGRVYVTPGFDLFSLISMEGYTPSMVGGQPLYTPRLTYRNVENRPAYDALDVRGSNYLSSRWRGQLTIRYSFK